MNQEFPPDTFTFKPPHGVQEISLDEFLPESISLREAKQNSIFRLFLPSYLPQGVKLLRVQQIQDGTVFLSYGTPEGEIFNLVEGPQKRDPEIPKSEKVEINGSTGEYFDGGVMKVLTFHRERRPSA